MRWRRANRLCWQQFIIFSQHSAACRAHRGAREQKQPAFQTWLRGEKVKAVCSCRNVCFLPTIAHTQQIKQQRVQHICFAKKKLSLARAVCWLTLHNVLKLGVMHSLPISLNFYVVVQSSNILYCNGQSCLCWITIYHEMDAYMFLCYTVIICDFFKFDALNKSKCM